MPGCRSNDPNGGSEHDCWVYPNLGGDLTKACFTGPIRPLKTSPMEAQPSRLGCMAYSPMFLRQDKGQPFLGSKTAMLA